MKSASLLVTVPDEVYENIVEPKKRERTFASFMNSLLQAYYDSPEIQSYVEGFKDNMSKKSLNSLTSAIEKANSALSRFGLYTDELESVTAMGMEAVKRSPSNEGFQAPAPIDTTPLLEQFDDLKSEIGSIKSDNKELRVQNERLLEQNAELINILGKISSGSLSIANRAGKGVEGTKTQQKPIKQEESSSKAVPDTKPVVEEFIEEPIHIGDITIDEPVLSVEPTTSNQVEDSEEELLDFGIDFDEEGDFEEEEDTETDDDIFSSFMENNSFTF